MATMIMAFAHGSHLFPVFNLQGRQERHWKWLLRIECFGEMVGFMQYPSVNG